MEQTRKISTTLTLDPTLIAALDEVAEATDRSRSFVAGRAIQQFLLAEKETSFVTATIERGIALQRKQAEIERERAEEHARQQERVSKSTEEYLRGLDSK
jgi:predicted transcriptional regulator